MQDELDLVPGPVIEAETGVIAAILNKPEIFESARQQVQSKDFLYAPTRNVFSIMERLHAEGTPIEMGTVTIEGLTAGLSEQELPSTFVTDIHRNVTSYANVWQYITYMRQFSGERQMRSVFTRSTQAFISAPFHEKQEILRTCIQAINDTYERVQDDHNIEDQVSKIFSTDSLKALTEMAAQRWLVDEIVPANAFGILYGPSEAFKSFVTLDIAACVATGTPWHGTSCDAPGLVIYVASEDPGGIEMRKHAWKIRHQVDDFSCLTVYRQPVIFTSPTQVRQFIDLSKRHAEAIGMPIKMIVIDTLAMSYEGDENSSQDMSAFIHGCKSVMVELDCSVMAVHHTGKDAERGARGSSALKGASDFMIRVAREDSGKLVNKVMCDKAKNTARFPDRMFKMEPVELGVKDGKGRDMTSLVPKLIDQDQYKQEKAADAEVSYAEIVKNLIINCMTTTAQDFVAKDFLKDEFLSRYGVTRSEDAKRYDSLMKAFNRALKSLVESSFIREDARGILYREDPF